MKKKNFYFGKVIVVVICKKIINHDDEKVRDHCHITGKFMGSAHWDCNKNFQLTKKIPVIIYN